MAATLVNVVVDSAYPRRVAEFWAGLLGWPTAADFPEEVDVRAPAGDGCAFDLCFVAVPEAKQGQNRLHLDLASDSAEHQQSIVDTALRLGARRADIGQGAVPWVVLADPEGNEFCVLEPRTDYARAGRIAAVVLESADPVALSGFWAAAAGWGPAHSGADYAGLRAPGGAGPWLEFLPETRPKQRKNRLHLDLAPAPDSDVDTEVARLRGLGATPAEADHAERSWRVLDDPQGNEFCVLPPD